MTSLDGFPISGQQIEEEVPAGSQQQALYWPLKSVCFFGVIPRRSVNQHCGRTLDYFILLHFNSSIQPPHGNALD
jgi:hypothetical protein